MTIGPYCVREKIGSGIPVSVTDFKLFHEIDFDDHDTFIERCLKSAINCVEVYTGLSLSLHNVIARFDCIDEEVELPYGPVVSTVVAKNNIGDVIPSSDYVLSPVGFKTVDYFSTIPVFFEYQANTDPLPEPLKNAILWQAWEQFNQKQDSKLKTGWKLYASEFRRPSRFL